MAREVRNALPEGFELERYRIEHVLGAGGFAITYLAQHLVLRKKVAIKEYLPDAFGMREEDSLAVRAILGREEGFDWGMERFVDEARTLAKFRHSGIVPVTEFFEANGTAYMVMENVEGETFDEVLKREGTLPEQELRKFLNALLNALEEVHKHGILHRDIKPANILIRQDGSPVLIDFGAARQALAQKTHTLTAVLTPRYAPNEQYVIQDQKIDGEQETNDEEGRVLQGPWTDIYALGATLYKAITGDLPPEAPERAIRDRFKPVSQVARGRYEPNLLTAIDKALALDPEQRPKTIVEFGKLLASSTSSAKTVRPEETRRPHEIAPNEPSLDDVIEIGSRFGVAAIDRFSPAPKNVVHRWRWLRNVVSAVVLMALFGGGYWGWISYKEAEKQRAAAVEAKRRAKEAQKRKVAEEARAVEEKRKAAARLLLAKADKAIRAGKLDTAHHLLNQAEELAYLAEARLVRERLQTAIQKAEEAREKQILATIKMCPQSKSPQSKIAACTRLIELDRFSGRHLTNIYWHRAAAYFELKQYRRAIKDYDEAIRLSPNMVPILVHRGRAHIELKQYRLAIKDFNKAIRLNPFVSAAFHNRGFVYVELKQYRRAIKDYDEAIRLNPDNAITYFNRGLAYQHLKDRAKAIRDHRQAIKLGYREAEAQLKRLGAAK